MADKHRLYSELYSAFKAAYPNKNAQLLQKEINLFWNNVKAKEDIVEVVGKKLIELTNVKRQQSAKLLTFWAKVCCSLYYLL